MKLLVALSSVFFLSQSAYGKLGMSVSQSFFVYSSAETETTPDGGDGATVKTSSFETTPLDLEIRFGFGDLTLYYYPVSPGSFGVGFNVTDALKITADLGIYSDKTDKPKEETSVNALGLGFIYTMGAGPGDLDLSLSLAHTVAKTTTEIVNTATGAAVEVETDTTALSYGLEVYYYLEIYENVSYFGSVGYEMSSTEEKESKAEVDVIGMSVTVAGLYVEM